MEEKLPILDIALEYFESNLWKNTITNFMMDNCSNFIGEEEFSHEHQNCHKKFCELIENNITNNFLNIIGITFEDFQQSIEESFLDEYSDHSLAAQILSILELMDDFLYFTLKMNETNI